VCDTKKTELLFLALMLRLLTPGGRCAVIVPDGCCSVRRRRTRRCANDYRGAQARRGDFASLGVFKPYAGVSTAILVFTKTGTGGTDDVWFYDMEADGWSLDDKRAPLLDDSLLGPVPSRKLSADEHAKNISRTCSRAGSSARSREKESAHGASFLVPKADIVAQNYDLSIGRYKEVIHEEVHYDSPEKILDDLDTLTAEIAAETKKLRKLLKDGK
jgi:type I restriction enzyme M protein